MNFESNTTTKDRPPELQSLDQSLTESRSGRRLDSIISSVESFLDGQVERLESAIDQCNRSVDNDRIVQQILAEFKVQKQQWETTRVAEMSRLELAGHELTKAWEELENERRRIANPS